MREPGTERPNIVLINCDDLGYGDLGCYGSPWNNTPAVDRLAGEGMKFTDFYMASPVCSPSRGAMMTGCYPPRIGFDLFDGRIVLFPGQGIGLNPEEKTVATLLKERGYATMHIGKWHCGDQPEFLPTSHGFDHYFGLPYSNDMGRQSNLHGGDLWPPLPLLDDEDVTEQQPDQALLTQRYTERAVDFIRENSDGPFFLYFAHMHVHLPHYVPERFTRASKNGVYGGAVEYIDWSLSVIMDELEQLGLDDNTMIVFTSDNGSNTRFGGSNQPLRGRKGQTWEGGQRVPCLVRWPGKVPAGGVCSEVATAMDFLPTFAGLAGANVPDDRIIDGRDIFPLMQGDPDAESPHEAFFYYRKECLDAVRAGRWKLHVHKIETGPIRELYDLQRDVRESVNVYDEHPEVVARLEKLLAACRADLGDKLTGTVGANRRPIGRVDNPKPLTEYDEKHPYVVAMYDLPDNG